MSSIFDIERESNVQLSYESFKSRGFFVPPHWLYTWQKNIIGDHLATNPYHGCMLLARYPEGDGLYGHWFVHLELYSNTHTTQTFKHVIPAVSTEQELDLAIEISTKYLKDYIINNML